MGTEIKQVLQKIFRTIDGQTEIKRVARLDVPAVCSSFSQTEPKCYRSCVKEGLILAVIERCALVARLGVGGERSQTGYAQFYLKQF